MINCFIQICLILILLVNAASSQSKNIKKEAQGINVAFTIKLFNDVDVRDAEVAIRMWGNEVLSGLGVNYYPNTKVYNDISDLSDAIKDNKIDLISLLSTEYFDIENTVDIEPYLMTHSGGKNGFTFILLVRKNKDITSIKNLKDKQINLPSGSFGQLVKMWLTCNLFDNELSYSNFFSEVREVDKPSQALFPVFFKQVDACVVSEASYETMIELNPQLKNDLIVIERSPELVNGLMCVNKRINKKIKEVTLNTSLKISNTASGKQLLALFRSDDLVKFKHDDLKTTKDLYEKYKKIEKK